MQTVTTLDQGDTLITSTTAREIAGNISEMTLWRWMRDGVIPKPLKIRRRNFWPRSQFIAALADAGRTEGTTTAPRG